MSRRVSDNTDVKVTFKLVAEIFKEDAVYNTVSFFSFNNESNDRNDVFSTF